MKPFLLLLAGLLAATATHAQGVASSIEKAPADTINADMAKAAAFNRAVFKFFSGEIHTSAGYAAGRYGGLNDLLASNGMPTLAASQLSYGFGFNARLQRVVLGVDGVLYDNTQEGGGYRMAVASSTAMPYLGYAIFSKNYAHSLVPTLGVGFNEFDLTVTSQALAGANSVGGLLAGPVYSRTLHYRSTSLLLGAQYNWYPFDEEVLKRCQVGVRLGYLARLGSGRYYADDFNQPVAGPAFSPLLFSARATVGFSF